MALLSDLNDYPLEKDTDDCINCVHAKPFDLDFDVQVEAAEELYGMQLKFSFNRYDISELVEFLKDLYPEEILERTKSTVYAQLRKYQIYFW